MIENVKRGRSYAVNSAADADPASATAGRLINDQNGATGGAFRLGKYPASYNACEAIAVHNALTLLGLPSRLCEVIDAIERNKYFWFINNGAFGTNPRHIPKLAAIFGAKCERVKKLSDCAKPGIYIVSYFNTRKLRDGVHTVCFRNAGDGYDVYNLSGAVSHRPPEDFASRTVRCYRVSVS